MAHQYLICLLWSGLSAVRLTTTTYTEVGQIMVPFSTPSPLKRCMPPISWTTTGDEPLPRGISSDTSPRVRCEGSSAPMSSALCLLDYYTSKHVERVACPGVVCCFITQLLEDEIQERQGEKRGAVWVEARKIASFAAT